MREFEQIEELKAARDAEKKILEEQLLLLSKEKSVVDRAEKLITMKRAALLTEKNRYTQRIQQLTEMHGKVIKQISEREKMAIMQARTVVKLQKQNKRMQKDICKMQQAVVNMLTR